MVSGNLSGRIIQYGSDPNLGRWSFLRLRGHNGIHVLVVTAYLVCKTSINSTGPTTAFRQQYTILRSQGVTHPNPRQQFLTDLGAFLKQHQDMGDRIILLGDFNTDLDNPNDAQQLQHMTSSLHLIDVARHHQALPPPATRHRGHRIDTIFASTELAHPQLRCGVGLLHSLVDSDHRPIFIDLPCNTLLGCSPPQLFQPPPRGIHSNNPRECSIYISRLHSQLAQHNVFSRVSKLQSWTLRHGLTSRLIDKWEALDRDITAACLYAERQTGSQDRAPWSPKLHQAHLLVLYWRIVVRVLKTSNDPTAHVAAILPQLQHPPHTHADLPDAIVQLRKASQQLRTIRVAASTLRQSHLEERAQAAAAAHNTSAEAIIKRIIQAENTSSAYRILRSYLKPGDRGNIGEIEIINDDGTTSLLEEPIQIFQKIIERDQRHYSQAEGTPFTCEPLRSLFGLAADTPQAQQFLHHGDLNIQFRSTTLPETLKLLAHMRPLPQPPPAINTHISTADYRKFFKKWKESTSTSDQRHLGHWKALVSDLLPDDPNKDSAEQIIKVLVQQLNLSTQHGYAWRRWRRIVSAKIPKREGILLLDKLRTIHLFEPDFNWILGMIFGKRLLHSANHFHLLHDSQFGSRPGCHALGAVFLKLLSYEVCRLTRTPFASFDNDAKSCYDRIIISMAMYLCQQMGMPLAPCLMVALCLQNARYHIKTKFGISAAYYTSCPDFPTHGPGQGSRMAPLLWLLISCLLFKVMFELCEGATFTNPQHTLSLRRTGDGFVDDVTNVCNFGFPESLTTNFPPPALANRLQTEAQTWERLLWSAGGALELTKCFYYLICWKFTKEGRPTMLAHDELHACSIRLTSGLSSTPLAIEHKPATEAHRTLGVWLSPTADSDTQTQHCLARSQQITAGLRSNKLTRTQAWMAYRHIWIPSVGYPLACSNLSPAQLDKIQKSALRDFLPHLGFARNFPRAVLFGPTQHGGLALRSLQCHQGIEQTLLLLQHLRLQDSPGQLARITLDWYQIYCGVSFPILAAPNLDLPHAPPGWITSLRTFLHRCNGRIMLFSDWLRLPTELRAHDHVLMNAFMSLSLRPSQIKQLNYCRLYLQVESLSKICSLDGTHILPDAWHGRPLPSQSKLYWPTQARPATWALWRSSLARLFLRNQLPPPRPRPADLVLHTPLGLWRTHHSQYRNWPTYASETALYLLQATGQFRVLPRDILPQDRHRLSFRRNQQPPQFVPHPPDVPPCPIIQEFHSHFRTPLPILHTQPSHPFQAPDPSPSTFISLSSYFQALPLWEKDLIAGFINRRTGISLRQYLRGPGSPHLFLVSDGSAGDDVGSFGYAIADSASVIFFHGSGHTKGSTPSSFRAEAYGALACFRFLYRYLQYFPARSTRPATITFFCDNESLIKTLNTLHQSSTLYPKDMTRSDFDVLIAIRHTLQQLLTHFHVFFHHVRGHQDSQHNLRLSWQANLNILCDSLANSALSSAITDPLVTPASYCPAHLVLGDHTVTGHFRSQLSYHFSSPQLLTYLRKRNDWPEIITQSIHWNAHQQAINRFPISHRPFICKLIHSHLPLGTRLRRWTPEHPAICPSCQHPDEDFQHFLTCPARVPWLTTQLETFRATLNRFHTAPNLRFLLMTFLRHLFFSHPVDDLRLDPLETQLIQAQAAIGWQHILTGHFATNWEELQARHSPRHGKGWTSKIITALWHLLQDLWFLRNLHLHQSSPALLEPLIRRRLNSSIRDLYEVRDSLSAPDQRLLPASMDVLLQQPTSILQTWLHMTDPAVEAALAELPAPLP